MHQERQRAGQQLEVNEDWANFGIAGQPKPTTGITGFLGVSNSTVVVDGGAEAHEEMTNEENNQISSFTENK